MLRWFSSVILIVLCVSCNEKKLYNAQATKKQPVYTDVPYTQDYSIKYDVQDSAAVLYQVYADRNGVVKILSSKGLLQPYAGEMLYPGKLVTDGTYRPMTAKKLAGIGIYQNQFVFADDKAVLSNAWAGTLYSKHGLPGVKLLAGGADFAFLVSDGTTLQYLNKNSEILWEKKAEEPVLDITYDSAQQRFLILSPRSISVFNPAAKELAAGFKGDSLTCFTLSKAGKEVVAGTPDGYIVIDGSNWQQRGEISRRLPWTEITTVTEIDGKLWFGSARGAFRLNEDGKFSYYASKRWLPSDQVKHISKGPEGSVLILTDRGLGRICFEQMTLAQKAAFYDKQVRERHIRYGLYCDIVNVKNGNLSTSELAPHDSDNLWTAMYLGSQLFRYLATHDPEAKQNVVESFDALERLYTIHTFPGYFGRSFERHGAMPFKTEFRDYLKDYWYPGYQSSVSWRQADSPEWDWRGASSSDQAVGQVFALTLVAQYMDDENLKQRAVKLIDGLMSHIVDNDLKLIDADGKPTLWGIWNPEYVNRFPVMVGDRKLYSSNIIAFLQAAYYFTGKEKFKKTAEYLLYGQGYLQNLARPVRDIGRAPDSADNWSRAMSEEWNHSDDEMYFLAYWSLYPYALNDSLKAVYREAVRDHWEAERPEKDALWNFCYAMTGAESFDLAESIWHLQEMPLDMVEWSMSNSFRKDINFIPGNFRGQTTESVLPPDERPEQKHNRNLFTSDKQNNGRAELGAGDTWLLPYWMGRYLGVISNGKP
ncbi:MAG: hypothetical protein KF746_06980 [Chitinophagaceae bacterium]|nr:hypothetical protein [Chitinophagaceae bacterium]